MQNLALDTSALPHPPLSQSPPSFDHQRSNPFGDDQFQSFPSVQPPPNAYPPYQQQHPMFQQQPAYIPPTSSHIPNYGYNPQSYYQPPQLAEFSVETMHGMPGYPGHPPIPRSNHTSPMNPSPPYPHHPPSQPYSRPSTAQTQAYGGMWGSPPMSPVLDPMHYGSMGSMGRGGPSHHASPVNEFGGMPAGRGMYYGAAPASSWTSPSTASQYAFYTPPQHQPAIMDKRTVPEAWSAGASPVLAQGPFSQRGSWTGPYPQSDPQANRLSWSGPSRLEPRTGDDSPDKEKERERKAYHPQPPARRSDWVMWVGNV